MNNRRSFLSGLATLPLVGGSVALIGNPTAAAVPVTPSLLDAYDTWLDLERSFLRFERFSTADPETLGRCEIVFRDRQTGQVFDCRQMNNAGSRYMSRRGSPSSRAAVILSAAGVPLTGGRS